MMKSKNFIFKEVEKELVFVGDFEGYYQHTEEPWDQSANSTMSDYYNASRTRLTEILKPICKDGKVAEIGCGLGYVTEFLAKNLPNIELVGFDISPTAIKKANALFPHLNFELLDITSPELTEKKQPQSFEVIVLNQVLWYILESLPQVLKNISTLIRPNGYLLISNAFAREQRYGNDVIDHFDGAVNYFRQLESFELLHASFYNDGYEHDDGHLLLKLK